MQNTTIIIALDTEVGGVAYTHAWTRDAPEPHPGLDVSTAGLAEAARTAVQALDPNASWLDRMHAEHRDLRRRRKGLLAFAEKGFPGVSDHQRRLLEMQLDYMTAYEAVLALRLADATTP